jgi:hypothetical protein
MLAMADQIPLSMGIFPSTLPSLTIQELRSLKAVNGVKFALPLTMDMASEGHSNRLEKYDCYEIEEKEITFQVMQRNGRAKMLPR